MIDHKEFRENPKNYERQLIEIPDPSELFQYINEQFFYTQHMGSEGSIRLSYEKGEERAVKLVNQINELKKQVVENGWFDCKESINSFLLVTRVIL